MTDINDMTTKATENLGSHLLGRIPSPPDARDHRAKDLISQLKVAKGDESAIADMTIRQIVTQTNYFSNWWNYVKFWRVIKQVIHDIFNPPTPTPVPPTPTPDPTPTPVPPTPDPTPTPTPPAPSGPWQDDDVLDQGQTGHCVGFGSTGLEDSYPNPHNYDNAWAHAFYYYIKNTIDGVPMSDPNVEEGTYVRSAGKALAKKGYVTSYAFAASVDEIIQWLQLKGPVVMGTNWYNDMFNPDARGFITPTGSLAGGHCFLCVGYENGTFEFINSWGTGWANGGHFFMTEADFRKLFAHSGTEAMVTLDAA